MPETDTAPAGMTDENKKKLLDRLARVEGQLRAIQRMVSEEQSCEAIAQQMAAARGALQKAFVELVTCALEHRVLDDEHFDAATQARVTELMTLLTRYS